MEVIDDAVLECAVTADLAELGALPSIFIFAVVSPSATIEERAESIGDAKVIDEVADMVELIEDNGLATSFNCDSQLPPSESICVRMRTFDEIFNGVFFRTGRKG